MMDDDRRDMLDSLRRMQAENEQVQAAMAAGIRRIERLWVMRVVLRAFPGLRP